MQACRLSEMSLIVAFSMFREAQLLYSTLMMFGIRLGGDEEDEDEEEEVMIRSWPWWWGRNKAQVVKERTKQTAILLDIR